MLSTAQILPLPAPPSDGDLGPLPLSQVTEQDEIEKTEEDSNSAPPASVATHTRTIGIIHPPPDIRNIVDKTSQFVARNGNEFVKRIIAENAGNSKFNFLTPSDPYHAYYQHRLAEFRAQIENPASVSQPVEADSVETVSVPVGDGGGEAVAEKADPSAPFRVPRKVLEPPEAELYTVRLPEGITGEELDIIKLTAQFVARNGKNFLGGLTTREINNPQFHFMKPSHSMFVFFTSLADAYSRVLVPPKGLKEKLKKSYADMTTVLERCVHRLEWERSQEQARQKAEDEVENERVQMAMIDWNEFVVVETIDFADDEDEELPPPMSLEEVIRRSRISTMEEDVVVEPRQEVEMEMDEEEMQLVEEGMKTASIDEEKSYEVMQSEEQERPLRVVKNWKRPEDRVPAERDPTKFVVSPITGELIPINEMSEHMRISLIDPKFKEQKERMFAKIRDTTLAQDDEISRNIVGLARTRPDIFGTTEEEVSNAVKAEMEKMNDDQPKQVIWDGHSGSITWTANQAMSQGINGEDLNGAADPRGLPGPPPRPLIPPLRPLQPPPSLALNNIPRIAPNPMQYPVPPPPMPRPHMLQQTAPPPPMPFMGNRPPMPMPVLPLPGQFQPLPVPRPFAPMNSPFPHGMPPPPPEEAPPPLPEEPEPKRFKHDDASLIPEDQFLAQHPGPARITISLPNVEEGNLKGQFLEIIVQSLSETVGSLKEKIAGEIQLPANKQKLSGKPGFLKDNMSLAHYNIAVGEALSLSLRERGGRKR